MSGDTANFTLPGKTFGAHSVRCPGVKPLLKEFRDRNPAASMLDLLAPGADPEESFQIEEACLRNVGRWIPPKRRAGMPRSSSTHDNAISRENAAIS
jgi:hypothetical protein